MGHPGIALVSLTFDAGGNDDVGRVESMLDWLAENELITTWFLEPAWAQAHPEIVRRIAQNAHEIGSLLPPSLAQAGQGAHGLCREMMQNEQMLSALARQPQASIARYVRQIYSPFFSPPPTLAAQMGYRTVQWSIDPGDEEPGVTKQDILNRIFENPHLKPGAIIVMHAGSAPELKALHDVIDGLIQRGFDIVPLGQLLLGDNSG
jgi:peptidoglycan/xylan/chitin deacetylase (PgdA/CDA1 family)